jgi:hypothetical protein
LQTLLSLTGKSSNGPPNSESLISTGESGIIIFLNGVLDKQDGLKLFTVFGIEISSKLSQKANAPIPKVVTELGIDTDFNFEHFKKPLSIVNPTRLSLPIKSYQLDNVGILIIPYQQKVAIDVTFQTAFIFPA